MIGPCPRRQHGIVAIDPRNPWRYTGRREEQPSPPRCCSAFARTAYALSRRRCRSICARPGSTSKDRARRSIRRISRSRPSTRCGRTERASVVGSICLPARRSMRRAPDAWEFPIGTRLWKEFSLGRPIETRSSSGCPTARGDSASYVWNADGTDATLAPSDGIAALPTPGAARDTYSIPAESDCRACHEGAAVPVLGFGALQLSSDRDPLAPHAEARTGLDLSALAARGLIKNLQPALVRTPPRIDANSPAERASLGYLHGNCAHCHNDNGAPVPVDLTLAQSVTSSTASAEQRAALDGRCAQPFSRSRPGRRCRS